MPDKTKWFRTDDFQICRQLKKNIYEFIEFKGADDLMISSSDIVDLSHYRDADTGEWNKEAQNILSAYYSSLQDLRESAGDDENQKEIVIGLIDECGFDSFDVGTLEESWKMQPSSAGYCCDYTLDELKTIKEKSSQTPESVAQNRKDFYANFAELAGNDFSHENVIRLNRKYNI